MKARYVSTLCLVVAIMLAGCAGVSPFGSNASDTSTPPNQTEATVTTTDEADISFPAGYAESGIADPETAADQHQAALSEYDNHTRNLTIMDGASKSKIYITSQIDVAEKRGAMKISTVRAGNSLFNETTYHEEGTTYDSSSILGADRYNTTKEPFSSFKANNSNVSGLENMLENVSVRNAGTVTHDGETLFRYNATNVSKAEPFVSTVQPVDIDAVESFNGTVLVDEEGIIRQFKTTTTYVDEGKTETATISVLFTDIGSTAVNKPDWIETAE
ncbi:DUF7537 family lipoprotein [Halocatena pleomorpha]|uniref:LppX_LprAFG lipoprotein n=1 Tax=Halocatena pleomorpha TaxID=1785090 RepID=A0A3P3R606_9EURY|nr:hypothetical protein [Halocatena pleomorpha]RRJ28060.1 hypothetical protein EIK79_16890 [Halocatena pleomorpha]